MGRAGKVLLLTVAFVTLCTSAASATFIDFGTGSGGAGGTVTTGANVTGSGIFIDSLIVLGAPVNNGTFDVEGAGVCADAVGGCGLLSFDRNANTISIVGSVPALGILAPVNLLQGDLSGGLTVLVDNGTVTMISASGLDTKAEELLRALGLPLDTSFAYFAFETAVNGTGQGSPYTAISTDITNTAVPEPGSLMLLGTGISAVAVSLRRRYGKKS